MTTDSSSDFPASSFSAAQTDEQDACVAGHQNAAGVTPVGNPQSAATAAALAAAASDAASGDL